jgi:hypothetical protein
MRSIRSGPVSAVAVRFVFPGVSAEGGAIYSSGALTLQDVIVTGNVAGGSIAQATWVNGNTGAIRTQSSDTRDC